MKSAVDGRRSAVTTRWHATALAFGSVALVAAAGFLLIVPIVIGMALAGLEALAYPLWGLWNCLFPFLALRHLDAMAQGGITDAPVAASILQWAVLGIANVAAVKTGLSTRPLVSALLLAFASAALALAALLTFDLRLADIHL